MTLEELAPGDAVCGFKNWGCVPSNGARLVRQCDAGLFVACSDGVHLLDGQVGEDGHLVGLSRARGRRAATAL